jgi:hypothetical protein
MGDTINDTISDITAICDCGVRKHTKDVVRGGGMDSNEEDVVREIGRSARLNEGQGFGDGSTEEQQKKEEEEEEEERVRQFEGTECENNVLDLGDVGALGEDGDRGENVGENSKPSEVQVEVQVEVEVEVEVEDDASKERYRMLKEKVQAARETATSILGTTHMYCTILSSIVLFFC